MCLTFPKEAAAFLPAHFGESNQKILACSDEYIECIFFMSTPDE
jgi:hypothetical protein